ncbi:TlpA disulfide reductase family protein [Actinoplanes sp. NPDC026623]|uniref:TlpA family protein disulfide reductase n=1 Tax=Actinoplanes sp. NPDC026623 TaxID=3155610 RepID=UPI0033E02201
MSRVRVGPARWLALPLALLLAACTATKAPTRAGGDAVDSPFAGCAALVAPPLPTASAAGPVGVASAAADLPPLTLPCFTGGEGFALAGLRGPAVINLWGSWCPPCRGELPLLQELADRTAGRLHVVGVDTHDRQDAAASFAADKAVSFPTLFDPDQRLLTALGKVNLPVTVFVAADGSRFVYDGTPLDRPTLGDLVRTHTGVTVTE